MKSKTDVMEGETKKAKGRYKQNEDYKRRAI